jgi:hypothetical protein
MGRPSHLPALTSERARAIGYVGAYTRWANVVDPAERSGATAKARAARYAKDLERARVMAAERGEILTEVQLQERARQLRRLDLAKGRLAAQKAGRS